MSSTPGPWKLETVTTSLGTCHKIGPFPSLGVRDTTYACVYADCVSMHQYGKSAVGDELMANARLIRAAPDLLKALEDMLAEVCGGNKSCGHDYPCICTADKAKAAIAKAKGEI